MIRWVLGWLLLFEISTHGLGYYSSTNVNACKSSQEIICSSSCHVNETFATLSDGRQLSCSVSYVPVGTKKWKKAQGHPPRPPKSMQASCYKTYCENLGRDKVAMGLAWEAKEEDVRNGSLTGFSLFIGLGEYRVSLTLKGRRRETTVAECIKFRYICYGVSNAYLSTGQEIEYSVYSVPRSRLGDNKNGLSDIYIVPDIDQCRDSPYYRDEATTETVLSTTEFDSLPSKDPKEAGLSTSAVLGLVLASTVIAAALCFFGIVRCMKVSKSKGNKQRNTQRPDEVIERSESNTQGHDTSTASRQSLRLSTQEQKVSEISILHPMKVLVVIDRTNKHVRDKAHALVQNLRRNSKLEIISNLENSNTIIYEQREVSWYLENSQWADTIIFINGVAVLRKLDEIRNYSDEFIHAIYSHFSNKTYSSKRNIFLEYSENDLEYIKRTWSKHCMAFKVNKDFIAEDKLLFYLRRCANTYSFNEQASVGRQEEGQSRTSSV